MDNREPGNGRNAVAARARAVMAALDLNLEVASVARLEVRVSLVDLERLAVRDAERRIVDRRLREELERLRAAR